MNRRNRGRGKRKERAAFDALGIPRRPPLEVRGEETRSRFLRVEVKAGAQVARVYDVWRWTVKHRAGNPVVPLRGGDLLYVARVDDLVRFDDPLVPLRWVYPGTTGRARILATYYRNLAEQSRRNLPARAEQPFVAVAMPDGRSWGLALWRRSETRAVLSALREEARE